METRRAPCGGRAGQQCCPWSSRAASTRFPAWGFAAAVLVAFASVYFLPSPIDPEPFIFEKPPPALVGPLQVNKKLQSGQRIFTGQLKGNIYTGTVDGKLWMISGDRLHFITQMGQDVPGCGTPDYEPICGRPHGVRMDQDGNLIVVDSYLGLYKVDPRTGEKTLLLSSAKGVDGLPFKFLNGLEISKKRMFYFTDSSSKWGRRHHKYEVIETNHLGRLLAYNPITRTGRTVLSGLYMANGIALSPYEDYILIAETSICRIIRYWVSGANAGKKEVFVDNLPGYPDNIRLSNTGLYRVGISTARLPGFFPPFLDALGPYPFLKRFIAKVIPLSFYSIFLHKHGLFLEINDKGDIVASFHDPDGSVTWAVSDVFEHDGKMYLGNTELPFLVVLQ
ncbi:adipocyte plasma membrane-associated protein-like isoform X2 [Cuculus canorus]|uniref:adipocyte plasma membrane-associated protein-like isoform X2 n=1 Tax=Cuculus canorus TaxID=55661 RepID=UPI0023AAE05B|nr:adipocyte plasma membrane-associated protein-like isoform X2 [Cuculus canorus]